MATPATLDINPIAPPTDPLPPLRPEQIAGTAYDVLNAMHDSVITNLREDLDPAPDFPSLWRLAKHIVYERGPLTVYRYDEKE